MAHEVLVGGPAAVQSELLAHFVSFGEAARIAWHEASHGAADTEGSGIFGVVLASATISFLEQNVETLELVVRTVEIELAVAAFYRPLGERSDKAMAEIAAAPGFSDMSGPDWQIYNRASAAYAREQVEERRATRKEMEEEKWVVVYQRPDGQDEDEKKSDPNTAQTKEAPHSPLAKTPQLR
ncbi:MAG: hypothetical protein HYS86_03325 [Candidatus Chisholmbacteria bacterium]|nr:hypothetical protein [Candidatus Chisholmbacteria bacterium]